MQLSFLPFADDLRDPLHEASFVGTARVSENEEQIQAAERMVEALTLDYVTGQLPNPHMQRVYAVRPQPLQRAGCAPLQCQRGPAAVCGSAGTASWRVRLGVYAVVGYAGDDAGAGTTPSATGSLCRSQIQAGELQENHAWGRLTRVQVGKTPTGGDTVPRPRSSMHGYFSSACSAGACAGPQMLCTTAGAAGRPSAASRSCVDPESKPYRGAGAGGDSAG